MNTSIGNTNSKDDKPRWQYRFNNFKRAYFLLQEACERYQNNDLEQIAEEGMVQRFEYCTELSWKTIKDYLEYQNYVLNLISPREVIIIALESKIITNGEDWMCVLDDRNKMSYTYDFNAFNTVLSRVSKVYIHNCFGELYESLASKTN